MVVLNLLQMFVCRRRFKDTSQARPRGSASDQASDSICYWRWLANATVSQWLLEASSLHQSSSFFLQVLLCPFVQLSISVSATSGSSHCPTVS